MKKYSVDIYENFNVCKYGNWVLGFEAVYNADLVDVMRDVTMYLKQNNLNKEYSLSVNGKLYKISQDSFKKLLKNSDEEQQSQQDENFGL